MATFSAVFQFSDEAPSTATISGTSASSLVTLGTNRKFAIVATGPFCLLICNQNSTTHTATASNFEFPGSAVFTLETGNNADSLSIFNPGATSITYWVQPLAV